MKNIFLVILLSFFLNGCLFQETRNIKVNDLKLLELTSKLDCKSGAHQMLFLEGPINNDSVITVGKILSQQTKCLDKNGEVKPTIVLLDSRGGYLRDGFALGELFTKYKVATEINYGDQCMSACATAFLGGFPRRMNKGAQIMVHAPYVNGVNQTIECASREAALELKNYYISKIGIEDGKLLFDKTMSFCGSSEGWYLNNDAALLFNIITES